MKRTPAFGFTSRPAESLRDLELSNLPTETGDDCPPQTRARHAGATKASNRNDDKQGEEHVSRQFRRKKTGIKRVSIDRKTAEKQLEDRKILKQAGS